jgi:hypothetical protein
LALLPLALLLSCLLSLFLLLLLGLRSGGLCLLLPPCRTSPPPLLRMPFSALPPTAPPLLLPELTLLLRLSLLSLPLVLLKPPSARPTR